MSDSSVYELGDFIWDDFAQTEDHTVPHSKNANGHTPQVENHMKYGFQVEVSSNSGDKYVANCFSHEKGETDMANSTILGDSWSNESDNMFFGSKSDQNREVTPFASEDTRVSSHCLKSDNIDSLEIRSNYPILINRCTAVDRNSNYPSTHISETITGRDLHYIDTSHDDKDSSDLLYYNWPPHIENFEDVDRMFRGCNPPFDELATASTGNEDRTGWFSASNAIERSDDANFSCPNLDIMKNLSEDLAFPNLKYDSSSVNYSSIESAPSSYKAGSHLSAIDEPISLNCLSFKRSQIREGKDHSLDNKIHYPKKQQKQKDGKRKGRHIDDHHVHTSNNVQKQQNVCYTSRDNLNDDFNFVKADYHQLSDQTTVDAIVSGLQSENDVQTSLFHKKYAHASKGVRPIKSPNEFLYEASHVVPEDIREKLCHQQGLQYSLDSNSTDKDFAVNCNPASVQTENEFKTHSAVERDSIGIPADLSSLNLQESSSTDVGMNELCPEGTSFRQLQKVTEQLDPRTKLCIRDSLYRLAKSARQRHNYANLTSDPGDVKSFMTDGTNKCTGYMDLETNTNPIDRSIAHLLFHRPTDSPVLPSPKVWFQEPHSMKLEPETGPN